MAGIGRNGLIAELLTAEQMLRAEALAIGSGRVTAADLMEKAGGIAADAIDSRMGSGGKAQDRAAILCGPGNNGGDGYVIARQLRRRGWQVTVWAMDDPRRLNPAMRRMRELWSGLGPCHPINDMPESDIGRGTIIVDALFGIGLSRSLQGEAARSLDAAMQKGRIAAVDILSGINPDTGSFAASGIADPRPAEITVTFECPKPGHFIAVGGGLTGRLVIAPLGLEGERARLGDPGGRIRAWTRSELPAMLEKRADQHKYSHGHVLCVAGPAGRGGAVRLAARAALRIGAGLVTVAGPCAAMAEHAAQLNAVMLAKADDAPRLRGLLRDKRINAVCIGPGLGTCERARQMVLEILAAKRKTVLDADALTAFADDPETLFRAIRADTLLTPHAGEFARLFPAEAEIIQLQPGGGPITAVRAAAQRAGASVLLKGPATIIADPCGQVSISAATGTDAAPWLATAGSGDVLAGLAAGLLARGAGGAVAGGAAAYLHACAARAFGPGLIAEDIPELLPQTLRAELSGGIRQEKDGCAYDFFSRAC